MSWEEFLEERSCPFDSTGSATVGMGEWSNDVGAPQEGIYYLTTHVESPFSCEDEECFSL